mmetsp:Transcript_88914/g.236969  ORF Transcript_88914/g.236969 Transcript_88914/m.236969 type:complete len:1183 (+) Transcript_88914:27-3575(+)
MKLKLDTLIFVFVFIHRSSCQWTDQTHSVISSAQTFFAPQLPATLNAPHYAPDPTHPNLRFWFTPDSFEQDNTPDSTTVSKWRNVARIGIDANNIQTGSSDPQQIEALMQTTSASQPIYKKSVLNGRGVVRFTRGDVSGLTGQRLELFQNSSSSNKGFASSNSNPFTNSSNEWTLFVVARTTQATGDVGSMGIFSAGQTNYSDDRGMHIYKSCSTCVSSGGVNGGQAPACFPGKFTRFSTLNLNYGATTPQYGSQIDDNSCSDVCASGCGTDNVPSNCLAKWGPLGKRNLQDPDKAFRIITARSSRVNSSLTLLKVSMNIDGFHSSTQPPGFITGNAAANTYSSTDPGAAPSPIGTILVGAKPRGDGGLDHLSGDVAEILVYNKALTVQEMDRVGNYLARKFALGGFRLDADYGSATRSVALSCPNCPGPGPVGEGGTTIDSHITPADASYSGIVNVVYASTSLSIFNWTGSATDLVGAIITFCSGSCTAANVISLGSTKIYAATALADTSFNLTLVAGVTPPAAGYGYFISGKEICGEDVGVLSVVSSASQVTLAGLELRSPGTDAYAGMLLGVCVGVCQRAADGTISNPRGLVSISSSTNQVVNLATSITGVAVGDAFVLYNGHKVRLQQTTTSQGIAGSTLSSYYSFAGHSLYYRPGGTCGKRGTRIVGYSTGLKCATLGSVFEVGDFMVNSSTVASADLAANGACRGALCEGPDVGGIGGAASGHVSSVRMLSGALSGCSVGVTLSASGDTNFQAVVTSVSSSGSITGLKILNHGKGFKAGSLVLSHGSVVGTVASTTSFTLSSGYGDTSVANSLVGKTIVVCSGICTFSSNVVNARGSGLVTASTAGASPSVTLATAVTSVTAGDEFFFASGPALVASVSTCICAGSAFNTAALGYQSLACLQSSVGTWADAGDACAAGPSQSYVIVRDSNTKIATSSAYLQGVNTLAIDNTGSMFVARGAYLFPNDVRPSVPASVTNVQLASGADVSLNAQFLRVTYGSACSTNPSSDQYCLTSKIEMEASSCALTNFPRGSDPAGQATYTATDFSSMSDLPEIRCVAPAGAGSARSINIYWHGVRLTLNVFGGNSGPVVSNLVPTAVDFSGGATITISGSNFGSASAWTRTGTRARTSVDLVGRGTVACGSIQYVSDSKITCVVPALTATRQPVDLVQHQVSVQV